jgi:hypothetical protein
VNALRRCEFSQDLAHAPALHAHARDADKIGAGAAVVIDRLDVLVDQGHVEE